MKIDALKELKIQNGIGRKKTNLPYHRTWLQICQHDDQ